LLIARRTDPILAACSPYQYPNTFVDGGKRIASAIWRGNAMRLLASVVLAYLVTVSATSAAEFGVTSTIEAVTVYPDGATVTRVIKTSLPAGDSTLLARDFPPALDPSSLRVEGEGGARLMIGAIDARPPRPEPPATLPELERRIEALRDERGALDDKIAAATARRKFAQRFADSAPAGLGDKGEARPLAEWRAAFAAVAEEVALADAVIREAGLRQREIDRVLARLEAERNANPPRKMDVRIDLAADAATSATLRITYAVRGARWVPLYDARLNTGARDQEPALELVRRAEVMQQTGEDWNDVALSVSTVMTAKGGNAPDLRPLIVRYPEPPVPLGTAPAPRSLPAPEVSMRGAADFARAPVAAVEQEATFNAGGFQVVFQVPGRVSIAANEGAKSFRIGSATIAPKLVVRAVPLLDLTGYLEASFKQTEDAPLLRGRVALYRDGTYVGRAQMQLAPKDETVRLGFGADEKINIRRAIVRKIEGSSGIISSAKNDEREFKITVRNGHSTPVAVTIEDQVPVSEIADVQVELLPATTPPSERDVRDRRGVLVWNFDAAPGEVREVKLAWRVRWPADKSIVYQPRL
jgi:uncharacterized protein (TIGR02231 family)